MCTQDLSLAILTHGSLIIFTARLSNTLIYARSVLMNFGDGWMSKANRKYQETTDFFNSNKIKLAPTKQIRELQEATKKEKRMIRKALNRLKHKVE